MLRRRQGIGRGRGHIGGGRTGRGRTAARIGARIEEHIGDCGGERTSVL